MQESYDLHTIIIIITFLGILILVSLLINKKKDFIKNRFKNDQTIDFVSSSVIGGGNRVILFEVYNKEYLIVSSKNGTSNILQVEKSFTNLNKQNQGTKDEKFI